MATNQGDEKSKTEKKDRGRQKRLRRKLLTNPNIESVRISQNLYNAINRQRFSSEGHITERPLTVISIGEQGEGSRQFIHLEHPEHMKKVAICGFGNNTLFYELNQNRPLADIVQDICDKWTITNVKDFALQFSEPTRQTYITEENRLEIQNGNVLQLTDSPACAAQTLIDKLTKGNREEKIEALKTLSVKCTDATFAKELIEKEGLKLIIDNVIAGNKSFSGDPLMYLLKSFVALMDHGTVSWDILEPSFVKQVAMCISGARAAGDGCIQPALEILENVILNSSDPNKVENIEQDITADKIIPYLNSQSPDVQQCALALLNAFFVKSPPDKKQKLADCFQSKNFRTVIQTAILSLQTIGAEMAHQLYTLQRLMLNLYETRMNTGVNLSDSAQVTFVNKTIEDLRRIAFDFADMGDSNSGPNRKSAIAKDLKKLGFSNQENPVADFEAAPPGMLALDNMIYFAQCHKESYIKVVLENCGRANEQDCPFVQASIRLTKILCDLLKIGESPFEEEHSYYPMFFTAEKPIEEFFTYCIQLLNRTWKEMRASKEDFSKVLSVVQEQITRALDKSVMPKTFDHFKTNLVRLAYPELKKLWEAERQKKDESKAQAKPILELREMLKPDILELIRKHRLTYLEGGSRFPKYDDSKANRVRNKYQFWKLSPNHKAFHYGDCGENEEPTLEQLQNKVQVVDIKELVVGKNCTHVKNTKKIQPELAFQMVLEGSTPDKEMSHHFMANSEVEFDIWVDGISALLNSKMPSGKTQRDLDILLNMEVKLQLLETEGIAIPKDPPPIPPLPDNFNFAYTMA